MKVGEKPQEILDKKIWENIITFKKDEGEITVENWGGVDPKVFDNLSFVF
jgi:hypothetical protein